VGFVVSFHFHKQERAIKVIIGTEVLFGKPFARAEGSVRAPCTTSADETFWRAANGDLRRGHAPAGQNSRGGHRSDVNVVVQVPYRRLVSARIVKQVIWMAVAIKISHAHCTIAGRKSRSVGGTEANVVVEIPYHRLPRTGIEQEVIWMAVVVEVSWRRRGWLREGERARSSDGGKGASHSRRSEFIDRAAIRRKQIARAIKGQTRWSKPRRKGASHSRRS